MQMKIILIHLILFNLTVFGSRVAFGFPVPVPRPINQIIEDSDLIVVSKLENYTFTPNTLNLESTIDASGGKIYKGESAYIVAENISSPGKYTFKAERTVKGKSSTNFDVDISVVLTTAYGGARLPIITYKNFIVFLKKDTNGNLIPTDNLMPFYPIVESQSLLSLNKNSDAVEECMNLLLQSTSDPLLRQSISFTYRNSSDLSVIQSFSAFLNDKNAVVRNNVLYCFAFNKQVSAIKLISNYVDEMAGRKKRYYPQDCFLMLENFADVPEAVPSLNRLLLSKNSKWLRIHGLRSLNQLGKKESTPFFIFALHDSSDEIAPAVARILYRLHPDAKSSFLDDEAFNAARKSVIATWIHWWQDELSGKHPLAEDEAPRVTLRDGDRYEAKDLPRLNQGLFMRSEFTRGAAIKALDKLADQSSIPYLLLAQYDPKPDIAFGAYKTLHRLIPELGAVKARGTFDAQRETLAQQGFDWWVKYLQDNLPAEMKQKAPVPAAIAGK